MQLLFSVKMTEADIRQIELRSTVGQDQRAWIVFQLAGLLLLKHCMSDVQHVPHKDAARFKETLHLAKRRLSVGLVQMLKHARFQNSVKGLVGQRNVCD